MVAQGYAPLGVRCCENCSSESICRHAAYSLAERKPLQDGIGRKGQMEQGRFRFEGGGAEGLKSLAGVRTCGPCMGRVDTLTQAR